MKTVQARSLIVRCMLTMVLCAATGGRLAAQEAVAPVAGIADEAAPAAIPPPAPVPVAPAAEVPEPVEVEAAPPAAPAPVPVEVEAAPVPAPVEAEAAPAAEVPAPAVEAVAVDEAAGLPEGRTNESGRITISLDNIELRDVVQLFTRLSGANIICNTTNLQGSVTANLDDVEWEPAFRTILERHGLFLVEDPRNKGIFFIEIRPPDSPDPWEIEVFPLRYITALEAKSMVEQLLGIDGSVDAKDAASLRAQKKKVKVIDSPEANMVSAEKQDAEAVVPYSGTDWKTEEGRVVAHPAGNAVIVSSTKKMLVEIGKVLRGIDMPRAQVCIEAKIVELSDEASKKIGIDWSMLGRMNVAQISGYRDYQYDRLHTESDVIDTSKTITRNSSTHDSTRQYTDYNGRSISDHRVWTSLLGLRDLQVFLSALETSGDATTISNPKVIVANEEQAMIDLSEKDPYVTVEMKTEGTGDNKTYTYSTKMEPVPGSGQTMARNVLDGSDTSSSYSYTEGAFFSYGIRLKVTPRVNNATNITVAIEPTMSSLVKYYTPGNGLTRYPEINSKSVRTKFSLNDGQTAVIGGLTQTRDTDMVKKVPLLGDIPLLGKYLFSHTEKVKEQVETIIFVTVGIVDPEKPQMALAVPEGASLVHKHVDAEGRLIKWASPAEMDPEKAELVPDVVEE